MIKNIFLILSLLLVNFCFSQEFQSRKDRDKHKPFLFSSYLDTIDVHPNFFNSISSVKLNDKVVIQVMKKMLFKGTVHILHETPDYRTVSIESEETPTLRIILSHTAEDKYYGLIGCANHKDVFVLKQDKNSKKYIWVKKEFADILPD